MAIKTKREIKETERGAAGMFIELADGNITVYHCEGGAMLAKLTDAPIGTWKALWASMELLGIKPAGRSSMPLHSEAAWENYHEVG